MRISDWSSDVCSSDLCVRRRGRRVSSSGSTALCDNCCIAASRGFHPSRAGQGGSRGVHQVSETSAIEQVTLNAGDKAVTLPVARGTLGAPCIEIAKIGRAHARTPVTNAPLVCRLLLETTKNTQNIHSPP